tara:strand:- start:10955 stop:11170 length:216 start_codon:yes stop_codon:yes gene_type:complete
MGELCITTLDWEGAPDIGQRLVQIVPADIRSEFVVNGEVASLKLHLEEQGIEALRIKVDAMLALFAEVEAQ